MKVVVFDFDNTIIIGDATSSMIKESLKAKSYLFKIWVYILKWANRLNLIKSSKYKQITYNLVFKDLQDYANLFPENISWDNRVVDSLRRHLDCPDTVTIVSTASDESLVRILLENIGIKVRVLGSNISWNRSVGFRLDRSNFGKEKVMNLESINVGHIDVLYTDHFISDYPLINMSSKVFLVNRGLIKASINRIASYIYYRIECI